MLVADVVVGRGEGARTAAEVTSAVSTPWLARLSVSYNIVQLFHNNIVRFTSE